MALGPLGRLWSLARRVEELFGLQAEVREALAIVGERLTAIEGRLTRVEAEEGRVLTEARSAATATSTMIASGVLSDTVSRITRLEGSSARAGSTF